MFMNVQQRYERILQDFNSIDKLLNAIGTFQSWVRRAYPNAVLIATTAENGVTTHIGVYDVALQLQSKGYFKPLEQPCPQLLGERISLGTSIGSVNDKLVRLVQELSCWITAFDHAIRLHGDITIRGNDYVSTFNGRDKTISTNLLN
jgi:hypothetical protein